MAKADIEVIDNGVEVIVYPLSAATVIDVPQGIAGVQQAFGVVKHGSNANVPRPFGFEVVAWIGSATPINAIEGDFRFRQ